MTIEEAYAEPVARKRRRDRAFRIGLLLGILIGVIATLLMNRAAEEDTIMDDEPVVELQPAIVAPGTPLSASDAVAAAGTTEAAS